jgi:hypothetical protein
MKCKITLRRALSDNKLLGRALPGDSWRAWKILLIACAGERLSDTEREIFCKLTGRAREPGKMVHEFIGIIGRRGGKSRAIAAWLCWIAALCDHRSTLSPGERGVCLCISRDQRVAKIILGYVEGILADSPLLERMIRNRTADTVELSNRITIEVRPCSYKTLRGPTFVAVAADEAAFWFTSADYENPDVEVLAAVRPGLLTSHGPLAVVSSAYAQHGVVWDAFRRDYGPDGSPGILVAKGTSRELNPSLPLAEINRELERDPVRNRAEYLSEFRSDVEGFIPRAVVEACVGDYVELEPRNGIIYWCFVDAASGSEKGDSYAMVIGHKEDGRIVVDAVREAIPPFSPAAVTTDILLPLCRAYHVVKIFGDNFAGEYPKEHVRKAGLQYELWSQHRSELYRDALLPSLNSKLIKLPSIDRLINQCCSLERSTSRSGRDEISHGPHSHDDVINAVAGVAAVVLRKAYYKPPPIVSPAIFSKNCGWWPSDATPPPVASSPRERAMSPCQPPTGGNYRSSAAEVWYPYSFSSRRGRWPGS